MNINDEDFNEIISEFQRLSEKEEKAKKAAERYRQKVKTTEEYKQRQRDTFKRYYQKHRDKVRAKQKEYYNKKKKLKKTQTEEEEEFIDNLNTSDIEKYIDSEGSLLIEEATEYQTSESE